MMLGSHHKRGGMVARVLVSSGVHEDASVGDFSVGGAVVDLPLGAVDVAVVPVHAVVVVEVAVAAAGRDDDNVGAESESAGMVGSVGSVTSV